MTLSSGNKLVPVRAGDGVPLVASIVPPAVSGDRFIVMRTSDGTPTPALVSRATDTGDLGILARVADGEPCFVKFTEAPLAPYVFSYAFGNAPWTVYGNAYGELGMGTTSEYPTPTPATVWPFGVADIAHMALAETGTMALLRSGELYYAGRNPAGSDYTLFTLIPFSIDVSAVFSAGGPGFVVVLSDGRWLWSRVSTGADPTNTTSYLELGTPPALEDVVHVSTGGYNIYVCTTAGAVLVYGDNYAGQLGTGYSGGPWAISAPSTVIGVTNAVKAYGTFKHSYALCNDGTVYAWAGGRESPNYPDLNRCIPCWSAAELPLPLPAVDLVINPRLSTPIILLSNGQVWTGGIVPGIAESVHPQLGVFLEEANAVRYTPPYYGPKYLSHIRGIQSVAEFYSVHSRAIFFLDEPPAEPAETFVQFYWYAEWDCDTSSWSVGFGGCGYGNPVIPWRNMCGFMLTTSQTSFIGTGLNDCHIRTRYFQNYYTGPPPVSAVEGFYLEIYSLGFRGSANTFRWSLDGGATWQGGPSANIRITGDWQTLGYWFEVKFDAATGHTIGDAWVGPTAPAAPATTETCYDIWSAVYDCEELEWVLSGPSTTTHATPSDWEYSACGKSNRAVVSGEDPGTPDAPECLYYWNAYWDCLGLYGEDDLGGRYGDLESYFDGNWYISYRRAEVSECPPYDWRFNASGGYYYMRTSTTYPPSPPSSPPQCYYFWYAYWDLVEERWWVYEDDLYRDTVGPVSDWDCVHDCEFGDVCTCRTDSETPPDPPDYTPDCP